MQVRVIVTREGQVRIFIERGTFAEGKVKLERLLGDLTAAGVELVEVGDVEQHVHGPEEHVHTRAGVENG